MRLAVSLSAHQRGVMKGVHACDISTERIAISSSLLVSLGLPSL